MNGPPVDHTWFRQYAYGQGRWISPDPAGLAAVDPTNPQTWNRYAYVSNSPVVKTDALGLCEGGCFTPYEVVNGQVVGGGGTWFWAYDKYVAPEEARHDSIITTAFDPELGIYRGTTTFTYMLPDGGTDSFSIKNASPEEYEEAYNLASNITLLTFTGGIPALSATPPDSSDANSKFKQLEKFIMVYDGTKQPLYNIVTSARLFTTGALMVGGAAYFMVGACVGSGGLACGAAIYGGVHVAAGGVMLIRGGYQFTRNVTIPSLKGGRH